MNPQGLRYLLSVSLFGVLPLLSGCESTDSQSHPKVVAEDPTDIPITGVSTELKKLFFEGDAAFDAVYLEGDGLGPNYIRTSCGSCHAAAGKGPGSVQKMVMVKPDGFTPDTDQSALPWGFTARPYYAGGAQKGLTPPPSSPNLKLSTRVGLATFGRGYLEAIDDREIERIEAEQAKRTDGIHGQINRVSYQSQANPDKRYHQHQPGQTGLIGRFGHKARIATLDEFSADAAQGDMSMTSPLRPTELANPDGLTDDKKPGVDLTIETINLLAEYMRLLAIPKREAPPEKAVALFEAAQCSACHVPSLKTRADYPIAQLAAVNAPVFTDLLLHDMGPELADGLTDGKSSSRQWRTAPLIGLRFFQNYLHDGRAKTIEEAILKHNGTDSEARGSVEKYQALTPDEKQQLLKYVGSL